MNTLTRKTLTGLFLLMSVVATVRAEGIDLDCHSFSREIVNRLAAAKLLAEGADRDRALALVMPACEQTQQSAQVQYQKGREEALKNWLFEDMGGKPGNERLRRKR